MRERILVSINMVDLWRTDSWSVLLRAALLRRSTDLTRRGGKRQPGAQSRTIPQIGPFIDDAQYIADGLLQRSTRLVQLTRGHPHHIAEKITILDPAGGAKDFMRAQR